MPEVARALGLVSRGYIDRMKVTAVYKPWVLYTMRGLPHLGHDLRDAGGVSANARKRLMLSLAPSFERMVGSSRMVTELTSPFLLLSLAIAFTRAGL